MTKINNYSTKITKVQCVTLGTLALTNKGEIFYTGDNRYGQIPVEEEKSHEVVRGQEDA